MKDDVAPHEHHAVGLLFEGKHFLSMLKKMKLLFYCVLLMFRATEHFWPICSCTPNKKSVS